MRYIKPQTQAQKIADNQRSQRRANGKLAGQLSMDNWLDLLRTRRNLKAAAKKLRGEVAHAGVEARNARWRERLDKLIADGEVEKAALRAKATTDKIAAKGLAGTVPSKQKKKGSRP